MIPSKNYLGKQPLKKLTPFQGLFFFHKVSKKPAG
jgi:hypothetical protein